MAGHRLHFATGNEGKAREFAEILKPVEVVPVRLELDEIQDPRLDVISAHKATQAAMILGKPAVVDDSGLFVTALGGFPGPYSAYAQDTIGCDGIIDLLAGRDDRSATFVTVVSYAEPDTDARVFRGEVEGKISTSTRGENGFGFDSVFEYGDRTFAEMEPFEKNSVSHRFKALCSFKEWYFSNRL